MGLPLMSLIAWIAIGVALVALVGILVALCTRKPPPGPGSGITKAHISRQLGGYRDD